MSVVFRKGNVSIKKMKDNKYKIDYDEGKYKHFWKFVKELVGEKNNIFEAYSVISLKELLKEKKNKLSYHHLSLFFKQVGNQYINLEKDGFGKIFIDLDDIVIINKNEEKKESVFLCLGLEDIFKIEKNAITVDFPYKKSRESRFFSPELKNGKKFPIKIKKESCIYSLCAVIVCCLKSNFDLDNIKEELSSIDETKLYYALNRCLEEQAHNRYYLWI